MSSFLKTLKNPKTGKVQVAFCIDDYYGPHRYGYGFLKNGKDANWDDVNGSLTLTCDFYKDEELN